jgi:hypothetical protein
MFIRARLSTWKTPRLLARRSMEWVAEQSRGR